MWDYLGFLAYLRQVESTSYNEIESFIAGKIEQNDISWVPINKAMRLEAGETAKMSKRVEKENSMHDRLSQIEQSLKILVEGAKQEKQNLFK